MVYWVLGERQWDGVWGVGCLFGIRHLWKEGQKQDQAAEKVECKAGLAKHHPTQLGALESVLPTKVILWWAEMAVPLHACLTQVWGASCLGQEWPLGKHLSIARAGLKKLMAGHCLMSTYLTVGQPTFPGRGIWVVQIWAYHITPVSS